ncbi:MAG: hypothetical protein MJZ06_05040 [Bacteroidaceae bacterium]|nr:hypothetical protein [Bacteroidaceae bacterium]
MKTTFRYIFAIASLFAISSFASAQGTGEEPEQKYEGVHTEKSSVYDFTTQQGTITLESFVEGSIKPAEYKPLDIVFVWENTGTMNSSISVEGASNAWGALQNVIGRFVDNVQEKAPDARFSLVTFSQNSEVNCHLTTDENAFFTSYPSKTGSNNKAYATSIETAIGEFSYNPRKDESGELIPTQNVIVYLVGGSVYDTPGIIEKSAPFKKNGGLFVSILIDGNGVKGKDPQYMEYASSNYPDATSYSSPGLIRTENVIYYKRTAALTEFNEFFDALAKSITSVPDMGPTVMTKDVLSPSFKLPAGTKLSDIHAFAVQCTGLEFDKGEISKFIFESEQNKWKEFTIAPYAEGTVNPEGKDISEVDKVYAKVTTSEDGNDQLEITGFDYKTFFCGPEYKDDGSQTDDKGKKYNVHGYKFVITLPIVLASGNAATLTTNTSESGLYAQNGEQVAFFPLPEVYFAYITIVKKGLAENESALFKVSKKTSGGVESEICQVALTGDGKGSVSKGVYAGMFTPGDSYTVAELTDWGWTYNLSSMTLFVGDIEVTDDNKIFEMIADDPSTENVKEGNEGKNAIFTFTNAKKEGITVKNAENAKLNHLITTAVSE